MPCTTSFPSNRLHHQGTGNSGDCEAVSQKTRRETKLSGPRGAKDCVPEGITSKISGRAPSPSDILGRLVNSLALETRRASEPGYLGHCQRQTGPPPWGLDPLKMLAARALWHRGQVARSLAAAQGQVQE